MNRARYSALLYLICLGRGWRPRVNTERLKDLTIGMHRATAKDMVTVMTVFFGRAAVDRVLCPSLLPPHVSNDPAASPDFPTPKRRQHAPAPIHLQYYHLLALFFPPHVMFPIAIAQLDGE